MYCIFCGNVLPNGAKFCPECGGDVNSAYSDGFERRKVVYDGEVHKCPNCGDILDAHELVCETCGYERRGKTVLFSVSDFVRKLDTAISEKQRVNIIRNSPIPNNKEDIFEFLILAASNIEGQTDKEVLNAWIVKMEQCYQKACVAFSSDADFMKIQYIYENTKRKLTKEKRKMVLAGAKKILSLVKYIFEYPIVSLAFLFVLLSAIKSIANGVFEPGYILFYVWLLGAAYGVNRLIKKK